MNILFCVSECIPFAKTGGLADVAGTLPKYLHNCSHDVRIIMPKYGSIADSFVSQLPILRTLGVPMGLGREEWCSVYEGVLPHTDVPVYFIEHELFFGRQRLYNDECGNGFSDNGERFVFLSRACMQLTKALSFRPDILHAHDWHTASVPLFLNTHYANDSFFSKTASILTIHNMQYQGNFDKSLMNVLGVEWKHFTFLELEQNDRVNLLKAGIYNATYVNTVSNGYLHEITTPQYGYGLDGVVRDRMGFVRGILNGMDYNEWNPSTDKMIPKHFDDDMIEGKKECKRALQQRFSLPPDESIPLFGIISRLVEQKGVYLLKDVFERILTLSVQFVILGEGNTDIHLFLRELAKRYPHKVAVTIGYDNALAHKIEAGSDFFVMPSLFEPCGLNQMYSLRYGAIPIVRATGGLDDTIDNFDEQQLCGDGFKFYDATPEALYDTIGWATYTYYHRKNAIEALRHNGMKKRFTWEKAATAYERMYQDALFLRA